MPELIVASRMSFRHFAAWLAVPILISAFPTPAPRTVTLIAQMPVNADYGCLPATPIDGRTAGDFAVFWANLAFDYTPETMKASHLNASKWCISDALADQLNSTFWTTDAASRPSKFERCILRRVDILDSHTAGISIDSLFSWDTAGLKKVPMNLHFVVKKEEDGYRMNSVQTDFYDKSGCRAMLIQTEFPFMQYFDGKHFIPGDYKTVVERIKPALNNRNTYDYIYFSWCKRVLANRKTSTENLTWIPDPAKSGQSTSKK